MGSPPSLVTATVEGDGALPRGEQKWRALAAALPGLVIVLDAEERVTWINHALPGEPGWLGSPVVDHLDPSSRPAFRSALERALSSGDRTDVELRGPDHGGVARWYEATVSPLPPGDPAERALVVAHDVTARRRSEEAIRAGERRWNILAENIPDVVAFLDSDARILWVNSAENAQYVGLVAYDFLTEESSAEYRATLARVLAEGTSARFESCAVVEGVAAPTWYETILVPLPDEEPGAKRRVLAVARDVTDRKDAEDKIRASEQRWRALVDNLPDIVLVLDRDRRILSSNLPRSSEVVVEGKLADAFLDDTMLEEFHGHVARALETERSVRYEIRSAAARDGVPRWYDSILVPLKTNDVIDRLMVVTRDATSQRAMLAALAEKERLASIGMVAASVAHEVMNPLTYVLANLEIALDQRHEDAESWRKALLETREGARRMQQIVWDLRALGRAGAEELLYVDARSVLEAAVRLSGPEVGRTTRVALDLVEVPGVFASESQLCQVFINLLINAAQSMAERPPEERVIRVATRYDEGTARVAVTVADRGVGIPAFLHARIFEPFFTTKSVGTGLGLSISRDLVTRLGGSIEVASAPGEGTTFTVWLPTTCKEEVRPQRGAT